MISGAGITDQIRTALFKSAGKMILRNEKRRKIRTDDFEGVVKTDFRWGGMGDIYGVIFSAEIDCCAGKGTISFIVRTQDIAAAIESDAGFWTDYENYSSAVARHRLN